MYYINTKLCNSFPTSACWNFENPIPISHYNVFQSQNKGKKTVKAIGHKKWLQKSNLGYKVVNIGQLKLFLNLLMLVR